MSQQKPTSYLDCFPKRKIWKNCAYNKSEILNAMYNHNSVELLLHSLKYGLNNPALIEDIPFLIDIAKIKCKREHLTEAQTKQIIRNLKCGDLYNKLKTLDIPAERFHKMAQHYKRLRKENIKQSSSSEKSYFNWKIEKPEKTFSCNVENFVKSAESLFSEDNTEMKTLCENQVENE